MAIGNTALVSVASRGIDANFTHAQTPPPLWVEWSKCFICLWCRVMGLPT